MLKAINPHNKTFLTAQEAAEFLNLSLVTLKKLIYHGKIKTLKTPGGHHRILKSELLSLLNSDLKESALNKHPAVGLFKSMVATIEKKIPSQRKHGSAVATLSVNLAKRLRLPDKCVQGIRLAALFHDIGMIGISDSILNKAGGLSADEYSVVKNHSITGEQIMSCAKDFGRLAVIIRQHHERFDGKGYPDGLAQNDIAQEAKIISVADAFAAMTTKNNYKGCIPQDSALDEIARNAGSQFDPLIADNFIRYLKGANEN